MNNQAITNWINENHPGFEFKPYSELTVPTEEQIRKYMTALSTVVNDCWAKMSRMNWAMRLGGIAKGMDSDPEGEHTYALSKLTLGNKIPCWCEIDKWEAAPDVKRQFTMKFEDDSRSFDDRAIEALEWAYAQEDRYMVAAIERTGTIDTGPEQLNDWLRLWPDARVLAGRDYLNYLVNTEQVLEHTVFSDEDRHPEHCVLQAPRVILIRPSALICRTAPPSILFQCMWQNGDHPTFTIQHEMNLAVTDYRVRAFNFDPKVRR
jgi:hypothetical protein